MAHGQSAGFHHRNRNSFSSPNVIQIARTLGIWNIAVKFPVIQHCWWAGDYMQVKQLESERRHLLQMRFERDVNLRL
jgi:hypothetical protein